MPATPRLIAVALRADGRLSPHAGRALAWAVYDCSGAVPEEAWRITLTKATSLHEWHVLPDPERHPLHRVDVAIAASAGDGVIRRMAERGVVLVTTTEEDPATAVALYLAGTLPHGLPHDHKDRECAGGEHAA
ncbi:NifB/NifX family molybdenum-iron cluster-binding protein [Novispirillum sp. DQ9]|uniref:NifB/NifX family molybdenum-iron cluster-binding protein n=1 Tax=Novispirillum sp. DQ9 TaxID=3398612 RepID=UPI003C7B51D3